MFPEWLYAMIAVGAFGLIVYLGCRRDGCDRRRLQLLAEVLPNGPESAPDTFLDNEDGWCVTPDNECVVRCRIHYYRGDPGIYVLEYLEPAPTCGAQECFDGWAYRTEWKARLSRQWEQVRRHTSRMAELREDDSPALREFV